MRFSLICGLAVLAVALTGCGKKGSSSNGVAAKTPTAILADVKAAVKNATGVYIHGSGGTGTNAIALDLHLVAGTGGEGHLSIGGLGFDIVKIDDKLYFRGGSAFLKQFAGGAAPLLAGKWFEVAATDPNFATLTPLTDLSAFADQLLSSTGPYTKGAETKINGQAVIGINSGSSGGTLYVATTGKAYPVQISGGKKNKGTISLDDWDKPETLKAPPNPVDYAKLTATG